MQLLSAEGGLMSHIDPAALEFGGAVSVDLTDLHDAVLRQLGASEAHRREALDE
jgi:hypothetical protein